MPISPKKQKLLSILLILIGIVSFAAGVAILALPYWGQFWPESPNGRLGLYQGGGHFGMIKPPCTYNPQGTASLCTEKSIMKKEGHFIATEVFAVVTVILNGIFLVFAVLNLVMERAEKHILLNYQQNIVYAVLTSLLAVIANIITVIIASFQMNIKNHVFSTVPDACFYVEITLIFVNFVLFILSVLSFRAVKSSPMIVNQSYNTR